MKTADILAGLMFPGFSPFLPYLVALITVVLAIGKANAEAYQLQVTAMGNDNFTRTKIAEIIGRDHVKVMPDILIAGGNGDSASGPLASLLGMKLMQELGGATQPASHTPSAPAHPAPTAGA